jgi:hypothetical protein
MCMTSELVRVPFLYVSGIKPGVHSKACQQTHRKWYHVSCAAQIENHHQHKPTASHSGPVTSIIGLCSFYETGMKYILDRGWFEKRTWRICLAKGG